MSTKKRRKKKRNIFVYLDFLLIIVLVIGLFFIIKNHNNNKSTNNNSINNNKENIEIVETPSPDPNKEKYDKLNNINKKLDFFKDDYLDRYINYKEKHPELDDETIIVYVNIGLDIDFYTDVKDSPNKYTNTVLANKKYYLGEDYVPKDLTTINDKYSSGNKKMTKDSANNINEFNNVDNKAPSIRDSFNNEDYNY